ncbi:hypothetical protein SERLA73DRAFT_142480 [Serpula lacrymans var. lacrymans S7.3]|uniref:Uncharacterized protein n=1 Tax=Serpula lacrymans var. lacrymans (strain S7.3) TaxID=936435 RepID=F8Q7V3_SERL3|nr:hypothetical protein SERLA73DRAFT_142480 [Serpula lacrymans var. lacrymans S7.3]
MPRAMSSQWTPAAHIKIRQNEGTEKYEVLGSIDRSRSHGSVSTRLLRPKFLRQG